MVLLKCLFGVFLLLGVGAESYDQLVEDNKEIVYGLITHAGQIAELLRNSVKLARVSFDAGLKPENLDFDPPAADGWVKTTSNFLASLDASYQAFRTLFSEFVENQYILISRYEVEPESIESVTSTDSTVLLKRSSDVENPDSANELDSTKEKLSIAEKFLNQELEKYIESQFGKKAMAVFLFEDSTGSSGEQNLSSTLTEDSTEHEESTDPSTEYSESSSEQTSDSEQYEFMTTAEYATDIPQVLSEVQSKTLTPSDLADAEQNSSFDESADLDSAAWDKIISDRQGSLSETYDGPLVIPVVGVRGKDFPDYTYIPETNFICSDKEYIPGFYADIKSRCQVFHICWPDRVKSFLCPIGTAFNQRTLSCDYWYNSVCSHSPRFYFLNQELPQNRPQSDGHREFPGKTTLPHRRMKFLPVKAKTSYYSGSEYDSGYPEDQEYANYKPESSYPVHERRSRYKREASKIRSLAQRLHELAVESASARSEQEKDYIQHKIKLEAQNLEDFSREKLDRGNGLAYDPDLARVKLDRDNGLAYDPDLARVKLDRGNGLAYDSDLARVKLDRDNGLAYDPDLARVKLDRNNGLAYDPYLSSVKLDRNNGLEYSSQNNSQADDKERFTSNPQSSIVEEMKPRPKRKDLEMARDELFASPTESLPNKQVTEDQKSDQIQLKIDSIGQLAPEMLSESNLAKSTVPVTEETFLKVIGHPTKFKIKSHFAKQNMAPQIVAKVFDTAENIVVKGLMPLTKQILASNYIKVHKIKH